MGINNNRETSPLMERMRNAVFFMRTVAFLQTFVFLFAFYAPSGKVVAEAIVDNQSVPVIQGKTDEEKLSKTMQAIKDSTSATKATVDARIAEEGWLVDTILNFFGLSSLQKSSIDPLINLNQQLSVHKEKVLANFATIETQLVNKGVPAEILQRHHDMVMKFESEFQQLQVLIQKNVDAVSLQDQQAAITELNDFLQQSQFKKSHQTTDPNKLPFGTPNADDTREPVVDGNNLSHIINGKPDTTYYAKNLLNTLIKPAEAATVGPVEEDLLETMDAAFSDEITQLAAGLNNNPVEIYTWVHNNIGFIPSYGSIQGSQRTLETNSGNAIDTANLLIALLRVAGVPARYVYGTVDVPVDKVMNWVGGAENVGAAQQILGQGGVPNIGIVQGGQVTHIRMEHTWVEAWVDFEPSRGIKNTQGDSWIPMDASYKQYDLSAAIDLSQSVPFDTQALLDSLVSGSTSNPDGSVQNIPQQTLQDQLTQYKEQVETYITTQQPNITFEEVIGTQSIQNILPRPLSAGLPYKKVSSQQTFSEVPDNLRHKFKYQLAMQSFGLPGNTIINFVEPTVKLAGKKIALSFIPATPNDEALIDSYLPEPDPVTGVIDVNLIPNTLPGYLINLNAQLTIGNEVIQSAGAGTLGGELQETLALWSPSSGWEQAVNKPVAGEYRAVGLDLQGISKVEATDLQAKIDSTRALLDSSDPSVVGALTKHDVVGDMLYTTIFSYMAQLDAQNRVQAKAANILTNRLPSYGLFSTQLSTNYWFGIPMDVNFDGMSMDVDHLASQTVSTDNDDIKTTNFNRIAGLRASAMEHLVPEEIFSTEVAPVQAVSAVKALALAGSEGQNIWKVDINNLNAALAAINLDPEIENEIRSAVLAGKVATVHESPVIFGSGTATGYIINDPVTGAGAYKISAGLNGGFLDLIDKFVAVLSLKAGWTEALIDSSGTTGGVKSFYENSGRWLALIAFILTVIDIASSCSSTGAVAIILIFTVVVIMTALLLALIVNPILAFIAGAVIGQLLSEMVSHLKTTPLCSV